MATLDEKMKSEGFVKAGVLDRILCNVLSERFHYHSIEHKTEKDPELTDTSNHHLSLYLKKEGLEKFRELYLNGRIYHTLD